MIADHPHDIIDELTDLLAESELALDELIEPMVFILTDMVAQLTDYEYNEDLVSDFAKLFINGVQHHCLMGADSDTITIN